MLEGSQFYCCHIPRTGGDAIKEICVQLKLPGLRVHSSLLSSKHDPVFREGKDFVMSIRRLPSRLLSLYFRALHIERRYLEKQTERQGANTSHPDDTDLFRWGVRATSKRDVGKLIVAHSHAPFTALNPRPTVQDYTKDGSVLPKYFIRVENLRGDLERVLQRYYKEEIGVGRKHTIRNFRTEALRVKYDRNVASYFTEEQIADLYAKDPLWMQLEREAYQAGYDRIFKGRGWDVT
jgi:hypothetical protein